MRDAEEIIDAVAGFALLLIFIVIMAGLMYGLKGG